MATINSYGSLENAVIDHMVGAVDLAAPMAVLIMQAEQMIFHGMAAPGAVMEPLRCREMETVASIALVDGVGSLPADYLQWRRVVDTTGGRRELQAIAGSAADQMYPAGGASLAKFFTIIGMTIRAVPTTSGPLSLTYYAKPPALNSAASGDVHAFLAKYPMIYLKGTQAAAAEWLKDFPEMQAHMAFLKAAVSSLNREAQMDSLAKAPVMFRRQVR
jgi:hypothetical protein